MVENRQMMKIQMRQHRRLVFLNNAKEIAMVMVCVDL